MPPSGELNVAAMPPPAPAATRTMRWRTGMRMICPRVEPKAEPICTIGPLASDRAAAPDRQRGGDRLDDDHHGSDVALAVSGRRIGAEEALAWGLVSELVPADEALARTQERAAAFAALPTRAIAMTKRLFERAGSARLEDQLELEAQLQLAATRTDDFAEGVAAFLEKREPRFSGS